MFHLDRVKETAQGSGYIHTLCRDEKCEILIGRRNRYGTRKVFVKCGDVEISESRARVAVDNDGGMTVRTARGEYFVPSDMFDCRAADLGMFCMGE